MMLTMKARVLTGSKRQIAEQVATTEGDVREAIVFIEEASNEAPAGEDIFSEMQPFTVQAGRVTDSRQSVYRRVEGE
jgi:hypothetical protein